MKNLVHGVVLALWALMGVVFTLKMLLGPGASLAGLLTAATWWLWFGALVGVTTLAVKRFETAVGALLVHGLAFVVLSAIPALFPLSLLRLGLDLLRAA
jgi:hypothetical protein